MRYRTVDEAQALENWSATITENTNVSENEKLRWVSTLLQITENNAEAERVGGLFESYGSQGPEAVPGMGDVNHPGVGRQPGDTLAKGYQKGSGDMSSRQIAMAMNIASYTIGLDLLPVIPMEFPTMMFGYLDSVYAANLDQNQADQGDSDIYIELDGDAAGYEDGTFDGLSKFDKVVLAKVPKDGTATLTDQNKVLYGTYLGKHRITANPIIVFQGFVALTGNGATAEDRVFAVGQPNDGVPSDVLKTDAGAGFRWALIKGAAGENSQLVINDGNTIQIGGQYLTTENKAVTGDLVSAIDMHIPEFSKPDEKYDGNSKSYTASRGTGEKGTQNIVSLRMFSTSVEAGTVEVLGEVTRTQVKDLAAYGQDGVGQLYKSAQNELTQTINKDILNTLFRMGVDSAVKLKGASSVDLNLHIGDPATEATKPLSQFGISEFKDLEGVDRSATFSSVKVAESNSSAENSSTRARKILTRILAASNLISNLSRRGKGNFAVVNTQIATAIQDCKGFLMNPGDNKTSMDDANLYSIGTVQGGIKIYVDPNMAWNDNRVLVGRKGTEQDPGLKMFIYSLGDATETISETSMGLKMVVTSRYSLVPAGFYPQANYLTFGVNNSFGLV